MVVNIHTISCLATERRVFLEKWSKAINAGAILSRKAIAAANTITIMFSLYQAGRAIGSSAGGPPATFRVPYIAGVSGGAAVGVTIKISSEILESIKQLIKIGAISGALVSFGIAQSGLVPKPLGPTLLYRITPSGTLTPSEGQYAGRQVSYNDPRNKHTKVANHSLRELIDALKRGSKNTRLRRFIEAVKRRDTGYGAQLSREATDHYETLVRDALEKGTEKSGKFYHRAETPIGIDVMTGRATSYYRLDGAPHGAHIIPFEAAKKIIAKN